MENYNITNCNTIPLVENIKQWTLSHMCDIAIKLRAARFIYARTRLCLAHSTHKIVKCSQANNQLMRRNISIYCIEKQHRNTHRKMYRRKLKKWSKRMQNRTNISTIKSTKQNETPKEAKLKKGNWNSIQNFEWGLFAICFA